MNRLPLSNSTVLQSIMFMVFAFFSIVGLQGQAVRPVIQMQATGKGWGVVPTETGSADDVQARFWQSVAKTTSPNGIQYHGGKVMGGAVHVYFIWYGNWSNGPKNSDSTLTRALLESLYARVGGVGTSGVSAITGTYADTTQVASGQYYFVQSTADSYSKGKNLTDAAVQAVVQSAIQSGKLPKDSNGIYFVLSSSDVNETSGFCNLYCGWHDHSTMLNSDIKFAFVGNPDRCPLSCEAQTAHSPNGNTGADAMASTLVHETAEAIADPDLTGWYDATGSEVGDKCAWKWGTVHGTMGWAAYNQTFGHRNWLIQTLWENTRGGGCVQAKGGTFYKQ